MFFNFVTIYCNSVVVKTILWDQDILSFNPRPVLVIHCLKLFIEIAKSLQMTSMYVEEDNNTIAHYETGLVLC